MIESIIDKNIVFYNAPGSSKKRVLENVANFIHTKLPHIDHETLFECLIARERLGSTGIGKGLAIPHCRINDLDKLILCPVKLKKPIDFEANDEQDVDLLFVLLVPEQEHDSHLKALADIAKLAEIAAFRNQLRTAESKEDLYDAVIHHQSKHG